MKKFLNVIVVISILVLLSSWIIVLGDIISNPIIKKYIIPSSILVLATSLAILENIKNKINTKP